MENYNENSKIFTSYKFEKYLKNPAELNYFCKYSKFIGFNTRKIFSIERVFYALKLNYYMMKMVM